MRGTASLMLLGALLVAPTASAHHEAIFGPQSSLVLGAPGFGSVQAFTKNQGVSGATRQETTLLLAAGVTPFEHIPLSFGVTVPFSIQAGSGVDRSGLENFPIGVRYRFDLRDLQRTWGKDANYVMLLGALEIPTGTIDYPAFAGPFNVLSAIIASVEKGSFGASLFTLYRREGPDSASNKKGDELFAGGGVAWTPLDDPGQLLSFQLGTSFEDHMRSEIAGARVAESGGWELMVSPAIVASPHASWQFFALTSLPAVQSLRDPFDRDRWRIGIGAVYLFTPDEGGHALPKHVR